MRPSVKLLLTDPDGRVLLMSGVDPATGITHWYPVGGGVEPGETFLQAATREAWEETGLALPQELDYVWEREIVYEYAGRVVDVHEYWLWCPVEQFEPEPAALSDFERQTVTGFRWWSPAELERTEESVLPARLGTYLRELYREGVPAEPRVIV